jgi:hypothetical protein
MFSMTSNQHEIQRKLSLQLQGSLQLCPGSGFTAAGEIELRYEGVLEIEGDAAMLDKLGLRFWAAPWMMRSLARTAGIR